MASAAFCKKLQDNPEVYLIVVPFANGPIESTNCYVVKEGGSALVVDVGAKSRRGLAVMTAALDEIGVNPATADYFITHLHLDHVGMLSALAGADSKVYVDEGDFWADWLRCPEGGKCPMEEGMEHFGVPSSEMDEYRRYLSARPAFGLGRENLSFVSDGDEITVGDVSLKVLALPGHTRGHKGLFHPGSRFLISGDHVLFMLSPSLMSHPGWDDPLGEYLRSLDHVLQLGCSGLYIAHGELRDDFEERIRWLRQHHESRLDEVVTVVDKAGECTGWDVARRIRWNVPQSTWTSIPPLQRWCILGETMAYVQHLVAIGTIRETRQDQVGVLRLA